MKKRHGNFDYKEVTVEIERQAIGNKDLFLMKSTPTKWGLTETFDNAKNAAELLSRYVENTLLDMAYNNVNKITIKYSWEKV